ncbi:acetyltransferase [Marisediminicola sp. LYQ85]|uniref:acetyltransferase n=1 Tax=Marisediminicola sp. LYQ85 TaxID=3391062 RepID=UPI00398338FC
MRDDSAELRPDDIPIIDLSKAPGEKQSWDRPRLVVYAWAVVELLLITNPWQISSSIRTRALRFFGAQIGANVIFRPRTRVRFPWKLSVGDRAWIGEGVWIHNQDQVSIGHDAVLSQDTFVTTGSHAHRTDMGLITKPVIVEAGAWVTARCIILGGSKIGVSALITPGSVVRGDVKSNTIFDSSRSPAEVGLRFDRGGRG